VGSCLGQESRKEVGIEGQELQRFSTRGQSSRSYDVKNLKKITRISHALCLLSEQASNVEVHRMIEIPPQTPLADFYWTAKKWKETGAKG